MRRESLGDVRTGHRVPWEGGVSYVPRTGFGRPGGFWRLVCPCRCNHSNGTAPLNLSAPPLE